MNPLSPSRAAKLSARIEDAGTETPSESRRALKTEGTYIAEKSQGELKFEMLPYSNARIGLRYMNGCERAGAGLAQICAVELQAAALFTFLKAREKFNWAEGPNMQEFF